MLSGSRSGWCGSKSRHCTRCEAHTAELVIEKHGHHTELVSNHTATYFAKGYTGDKKCSVCGETIESRALSILAPEFSVKQGESLSFDNNTMLLKNVPQGIDDLSELLNLGGCTVECDENIVATGSTVTIKNLFDVTIAEYTASVTGDLNGDGYVDAFDIAISCELLNEFSVPEAQAFMTAADMYEDGFLDATDLAYLIYTANFYTTNELQ